MKKILSLFLILVFFTNSLHVSYATDVLVSEETKSLNAQLEYSKKAIQSYKWGLSLSRELYKIDDLINSISDEALLDRLLGRVWVLEEKYTSDLAYELLNYIRIVIEKRKDTLVTAQALNIIKQVETSNLSADEIKKIDAEVVKLQLSLLNSSKTFLDKVSDKMKESLYLEETWNIKINISGSWAMFWSASWYLNMTDYKAKMANFDSAFEAQIDMLIDASIKGEAAFKSQFSSFVNYISKDWNLYILFDKLTYSWIDDEEANKYLKKLQELAKNQTFLKIQDDDAAATMEILKNFNLTNFYSSANKALLNPMFKAYKKDWNKYYLYPTKWACDTLQYIQYKLSNFWNPSCWDTQYLEMLKSSIKNGDMYINLDWVNNYFWYDINSSESKWYAKVYYKNDLISEIDFKMEPVSQEYAWDYMSFHFVKWKSLDYIANVKSENFYLSFKSILDSTNKFSKIDFALNSWDLKSKFNLENKQFSWNFENVLKSYDYDVNTEEFSESVTGKITWNISGAYDSLDNLSSLKFVVDSNDNSTKHDYNYQTWESKMVPNNSKLNINYTLNAWVIAWIVSYKENDKEIFWVKTNWKYSPKKYFELNNSFSIDPDQNNYNWNVNIMNEGTNLWAGKLNFYLDFYSNWDYLKIDIQSDRNTTQNPNIQINTPTNSVELEKAFD